MAQTQIVSYCDQGCRDNLEDALNGLNLGFNTKLDREVTIAAVADGVGGNRFGEVASAQAINDICSFLASFFASRIFTQKQFLASGAVRNLLLKSFKIANQRILRRIKEQPLLKGMSTTAVCAVIVNRTVHVVWAGDSRCYKYSKGKLYPLTTDHSEIQKLINMGVLNPAYADLHPLAHTINQFLGMHEDFIPSVSNSNLQPGDVVIMCTDGLTDALSDRQIADGVCKYQNSEFSFKRLPQYLVHLALEAGSTDNITVLCCEYMPEAVLARNLLDFTLTGAYPVEISQILRTINKESKNA